MDVLAGGMFKGFPGLGSGPIVRGSNPSGENIDVGALDDMFHGKLHWRRRNAPTEANRAQSFTDLANEYEGQTQPLLSDAVTAAQLNQRAFFLINAIAPPFGTSMRDFSITSGENYELPFDMIEPHAPPRYGDHKRNVEIQSTKPYKRAARLDLQTINDAEYGAELVAQCLAGLMTSVSLTVMRAIIICAVWTPFSNWYQRLGVDPTRLMLARQRHFEDVSFGQVHKDPAALINQILSTPSAANRINTMLVAEEMAYTFNGVANETANVPQYTILFNEKVNQFIRIVFEGPPALATFRGPQNTTINLLEVPNFYTTRDQAKDRTFQPLVCHTTLAELITAPEQDDSHDEMLPWGSADILAVKVHNQEPQLIRYDKLKYADMLRYAGIWNNYDGSVNDDATGGQYWNQVQSFLTTLGAVPQADYYAKWQENRDGSNDEPSADTLVQQTLRTMKKFRDRPVMHTRDGSFPVLIGDIEPRDLPNTYLHRLTNSLIEAGCRAAGINVAEYRQRLNQGKRDVVAGDLTRRLLAVIDPRGQRGAVLDGAGYFDEAAALNNPPGRHFPVQSLALAAADQTLDQYAQQHTLAALTAANVTLDGGSRYAAALRHVPSTAEALKDFLTLAHAAQTTPNTDRAFDHVAAQLKAHSGKTTAASILKSAVEHLQKKQPFAALATVPSLVDVRSLAEGARPLDAAALRFAQLPTTAAVADAMDIDEVAAPLGVADPLNALLGIFPIANTAAMATRLLYARDELDIATHLVFVAVCSMPNTYATHAYWARKFGVALLRLNYLRPFQRYRMFSMAACADGGVSYRTPISQAIVNTSMSGIDSYVTVIAQFRLGVLVLDKLTTAYIPNVACGGILGGINTLPVKNVDEFFSNATNRPGIVVLPTSVTETRYNFPMHPLNMDIFDSAEEGQNVPFFKHSMTLPLLAHAGLPIVDDGYGPTTQHTSSVIAAWTAWDPLQNSHHMSMLWHQSGAAYFNPKKESWYGRNGKGPRGNNALNGPDAAPTWAGMNTKFPKTEPASYDA